MLHKVIREASAEEAPVIVDMIRARVDERVFHSRNVSVEGFRNFAFENPREGYKILVYQAGDRVVGYIDFRVRMGVGHILGFYVKPEHRREGVGKNLMEKALDTLKRKGCHKARLEVFAHNRVAVRFYSHLNFVQEGYLHEDTGKKDIIIMSKFLKTKT
ncbi:MAG: GNAT family N-acetyltransferase [Candidatus Bathyarchaeota archaeon]|nr:GNAT family N-acetyltransferase [Candidatus Bathyarchaeota archaeon]